MAEIDLQLKAIDALVNIHKALKNAQPANPTITNFIETLYIHLLDSLKQEAPSAFAQLEQKALSGENMLNQKENGTNHDSSLLNILLGLDFKSISFNKDLEKEELHIFMNLPAKNQKSLQNEVDLPKLTEEDKTANVYSDDREYITLEKEQEIISEPEISADSIPEAVTMEEGYVTLEKEQEIVSETDIAVDSIPQSIAKEEKYVTLEKQPEIISEPEIADGQISESLAEIEKVFTRLNAMEGAIESIPSEEKLDMIKKLSVRMVNWMEMESTFTPEYKEICTRVQTLLQNFISNGFFAEANSIINVFSKINNGTLKKDDKVRDVSMEVLRNLASDNNINILFKEINSDDRNRKTEACQIFAGFGNIVMNKLLSVLRNASDSKVRISILHIIGEMGQEAIPAIKASISMNEPWYYLRNLAYILGRIGNETSVEILKPLLLHKEKRVRTETFKSVSQIGGNKRGPLLLSVLLEVDQDLRVNIIEMLGKMKYVEAVTDLQEMLKIKSSMAKDDLISMQEKICKALGSIGSPEAIKTLSEVVESKSILGIGSYSKEVKYAAERALAYIRKK